MAHVTDDNQKNEIKSVQKVIALTASKVSEIKIKSQKDLDVALDALKEIGEKKKLFKEKILEGIVAPIKLGLKNLVSFVDPIGDMLSNAETYLKKEINDYRTRVAESLKKEEVKVEEKVVSGEMTIAQAAKKVEKKEAIIDKIPTRTNTVVSVEDATKVPDEFWIIDMVLLRRRAIDAHKAGISIPGVKVSTEEVIINR